MHCLHSQVAVKVCANVKRNVLLNILNCIFWVQFNSTFQLEDYYYDMWIEYNDKLSTRLHYSSL